jgi:hypothetical protein
LPGPKRARRERTDEWAQIKQWTLWPEQELYEAIRPLVLHHETAGERAKEIDVPQRTLARKEGNLKVEYQATALSLYELSIEKDTGKIVEVTNARRLETHFRSPQLDLWQLSDTEWLLALRRPEPVARKKQNKIVDLAVQLTLPSFGATG